jgi:hypothetical protein
VLLCLPLLACTVSPLLGHFLLLSDDHLSRLLPVPVIVSNVFALTEELLQRATNDPVAEQRLIQRMRGLLAPFVLRRLKSELAEQMVTKSHKMHEVSGGSMRHTWRPVRECMLWRFGGG